MQTAAVSAGNAPSRSGRNAIACGGVSCLNLEPCRADPWVRATEEIAECGDPQSAQAEQWLGSPLKSATTVHHTAPMIGSRALTAASRYTQYPESTVHVTGFVWSVWRIWRFAAYMLIRIMLDESNNTSKCSLSNEQNWPQMFQPLRGAPAFSLRVDAVCIGSGRFLVQLHPFYIAVVASGAFR